MDLFLHLGAHRTGSTTLQCAAVADWHILRAQGVTFWGPVQTRNGRFGGLIRVADRVTPEIARAGRATCDALRAEMSGVSTPALMISDENILGSMFANVRGRSLYGDAARRLARLRPTLVPGCRRIGVAIRSYDRHWTSTLTYVMRKERRGTSPRELAALADQPRRWRDVLADIASVFPEAELVVWPFEAMVDAPHQLLRVMAAPYDILHTPDAGFAQHHPSPDCAGLRQALPAGAARDSVIGTGPWVPFDRATRTRLRARYDEDIAWLRAGADGLARFIETPEFTSPEHIAGHPGQTRGPNHDQRQRRVG